MEKDFIKMGHTNPTKYKEGNKFVLLKEKNGFNHAINYSVLSEFDFVPKLIEETEEKIVWEWIDGEILSNPTNEDLKQLGLIVRQIHKSDLKFPSNNLRKRVQSYLKIYNEKSLKVPEIDDNYKDMSKLISRMGKINPCHNDLWYENIIKDKNGKLWLVDWEYSTMGDKHFDLAFFIKSMKLNSEQENIFLKSYDSLDDYNAFIDEWMPKYKKFVAWLTLLWAYAQPKLPFPIDWIKKSINSEKI